MLSTVSNVSAIFVAMITVLAVTAVAVAHTNTRNSVKLLLRFNITKFVD